MNNPEEEFRGQKYSANGKEAYWHLNEMLQKESKTIVVSEQMTEWMGLVGPN